MTTPKVLSYGSWKSPITSDLIVSKPSCSGPIIIDGSDYYWLESRPQEQGRYVIIRRQKNGQLQDVTAQGFSARSRVHEYGGGAYTVADGVVYFSNDEDQQVYKQDKGSHPKALTKASAFRFADFIVDRRRHRLICVAEDHTNQKKEPANSIVAIDILDGGIEILAEGADFYSNPRLSADGQRLSFLSWNHPNMPWDESLLSFGTIDEKGKIGKLIRIAGDKEESIFQPEWSPDGNLYFASDESGFWNLYMYSTKGDVIEPVYKAAYEFGAPQWIFGLSLYGFASASQIMCTYTKNGNWYLAGLDTQARQLETMETPYSDFAFLASSDKATVFRAGSPTQTHEIVELNHSNLEFTIISKKDQANVDQKYFSIPETYDFPTQAGQIAHAFYYPPHNPDFAAPLGEKPPLLVKSHGGPTSSASNVLDLSTQYWTSRGFAVIDVNYGGSTGFGRPYRERLKGDWGIVDVNDCANAAKFLAKQGRVDPEKLAIAGGSAGGYTTLCALTFTNTFKAGSSRYGVSDLEALAKDTHKFESRYLDGLIGKYPEQKELYVKRSPINSVGRLSCPIIFFQGLEDKVVPPNQTEQMVEALKAKRIPVAYLAFEGEQHGFRRAENIKRALDGQFYFYSKIFGFTPADQIEPVDIDNLAPQAV